MTARATDTHERRHGLVALVERQGSLYETLDALSIRQTELVEMGDADGVLAVLRERQQVLDELVAVSEEIRPFRERWADTVGVLEQADRELVAARVAATERLAERINERDRLDRDRLVAQRDQTATELAGVGRSRQAVAAYGAAWKPGPTFQDREG